MGLIAPKTFPPLHADLAIDAMQMDVVGVAADGSLVVREVAEISNQARLMYGDGNIRTMRLKIIRQAAASYAVRRMHDESCPMVEKWWYRESGNNKIVDITEDIKKLQVRVG